MTSSNSLSHPTKKFEFLNGHIGKLGAAIGMKGNAFIFSISCVVLLVFRLVVLLKSLGKKAKNWTLTFENAIFQCKNVKIIILVILLNHILEERFHTL